MLQDHLGHRIRGRAWWGETEGSEGSSFGLMSTDREENEYAEGNDGEDGSR